MDGLQIGLPHNGTPPPPDPHAPLHSALTRSGPTPYRVLIHDYAGHPFQADLSRELARRGNRVLHAYFHQDPGPKGALTRLPTDPDTLNFAPVDIGFAYSKSGFLRRRRGDLAYGAALAALIEATRPELVLSGNTPTEAQHRIAACCTRLDIPLVHWCQDFYSLAVSRLLARRLPGPGHAIGAWYAHLERRQMRRAAHLIHITEDFRPRSEHWGIPSQRTSVIPNWAPLDAIPTGPRDTAWARALALPPGPRFVYCGTLGLKHDPGLLSALAAALGDTGSVLVVSAGAGADRLKRQSTHLPALKLLPLQPVDTLPLVLASADVLLAVIGREAGTYSVPSKILSYLCAARPIVLAAPAENRAARIIRESGAGIVVDPDDRPGFVAEARSLAADPIRAAKAGRAGRRYAEAHFAIAPIADRFDAIFRAALTSQRQIP